MLLRKLLLVAATVGMITGQAFTSAHAGPLLDRQAADPAMQSAASQPIQLNDETMDDVSAGWIVPAILLGAALATAVLKTEEINHDNNTHSNHGCRGLNCNNDP
ncbi:MAG: hypothetical protein AAFY56_15905 [Pseudomonadota bacterium]